MNRPEAVILCRYVKAICPQQAMDEYTPEAWYDLLGDLRLEDCREAARNVGQGQPFIAPAEIRTEVKRIRAERIARASFDPPADLPDDDLAYRRWLAAARRRAGDGEHEAPVVELKVRDMRQIEGTFRDA